MICRNDLFSAQKRIAGHVHQTPILRNRRLDALVGAELWLKAENLQQIGAFKARGAYNSVCQLPAATRSQGLVTYSSGNHAQAVAWVASKFDVPATIFMPIHAPDVKVDAVKAMGATVIPVGTTSLQRQAAAQEFAKASGGCIIEPFDHPDTIAGQGTAFLELQAAIAAQAEGPLDTLFVPVGGGGLIAGACLAFEGSSTELIAVEPEGCDSMNQSISHGEVTAVQPGPTLADGLKPTCVGALNFKICKDRIASTVTVNDEELGLALVRLLLWGKTLVEPSGAAALAAACKHAKTGTRVGVLLSGGNVAPSVVGELLSIYGSRI